MVGMTSSEIIDRFGGTSALARLLGLNASTVDSWRSANFIPEWRQPRLLEMALERQVALSAMDFPTRADRIPTRKRAAA